MKKPRQPAKGIKSIRSATGAFLWDLESKDDHGKIIYSQFVAQLAAALPGGEEAAWCLEHMAEVMRIFSEEIQPADDRTEPSEFDFAGAFPDAADRARALYYVGLCLSHFPAARRRFMTQSAALGYTAAILTGDADGYFDKARQLGCARTWRRRDPSAILDGKIEQLALQGNWFNIRWLAESKADSFWKILRSAHDYYVNYATMLTTIYDGGSNGVYERGILYDDLTLAGIHLSKIVVDLFAPSAIFAQRVNAHVKQAVSTWLLIATRLRVVKDIRRVIGIILWEERLAWAVPFAEQYGVAANPEEATWSFAPCPAFERSRTHPVGLKK